MGQTTEEIIYKITLDIEATNKALADFANSSTIAAKATTELNTAKVENEEATKRQETAAKKTKEAVDVEANSIAAIRKEIKQLTEIRNATNTSTDEGRAKIEQINKHLDENNAKIKANVDNYTKQKIGIGDYSGALDKLIPGLGATANGVESFTKAGLAFIATPLGAVVAALALAIGALTKYFQGSEEGQNRLNKIMSVGSAIMEKLMDVVEGLGEGLYNAFTKPKEALTSLWSFIKDNLINRFTALGVIIEGITSLDWKKVTNGVLQLGTGITDVIGKTQKLLDGVSDVFNAAIKAGERLADLQAKLDKDERALIVDRANTNLAVAKLRQKAISEEFEEKKKTIEAAIKLEDDLSKREVANAKTKLELAQLELKTNGDDKDALLKVANATAEVSKAEMLRYDNTLKFNKQLEELDNAEAARRLKMNEDRDKAEKAFQDAATQRYWDNIQEQNRMDAEQAVARAKIQKETADKELAIEKIKNDGISALVSKVTGTRVDAQKLYNNFFKEGSLKETLVNTKALAVSAYKSFASIPIIGVPLGIAAAIAATAYGLTQAAGIQAFQFYEGGYTGRGNPREVSTAVGSRPYTYHKDEYITPSRVLNTQEGMYHVGKLEQLRQGGSNPFSSTGFAGGGYYSPETQLAVQIANQMDLNRQVALGVFDNMPRPIIILQDFEAVQNAKNKIETQAKF